MLATMCSCDWCQTERSGRDALYRSEIWCAVCGHGVYDLRTGRPAADARMGCPKCHTKGQFVETDPKPKLSARTEE